MTPMDTISNKTASPTPASNSGKSQHRVLPISRNSSHGYERPERARTSHACEPCRERKTKCDGERPSCRRCLHTGTGCHYGYGKGWRKRKTAEALTVTSRKLQLYENLLSDILPIASPEVRAMIDDVREQVRVGEIIPCQPFIDGFHLTQETSMSTASETTDPGQPLSRQNSLIDEERPMNSPTSSRLPVTIPAPTSLLSQPPRILPHLGLERIATHTRTASLDDSSVNRLPSITADGILIEKSPSSLVPKFNHHVSAPERLMSPDQQSPLGTGPNMVEASAWYGVSKLHSPG